MGKFYAQALQACPFSLAITISACGHESGTGMLSP
jgi:hypothetical protein